jgi:hypothetical protein
VQLYGTDSEEQPQPLIPPAGNFTVSSTNRLAEPGQIIRKSPEERFCRFSLAREGSSDPLMDVVVCRNRDLVSKYELGKVNFVSKSRRQGRMRDDLRSQTWKQLVANEVNTRASRRWRSNCCKLAGFCT